MTALLIVLYIAAGIAWIIAWAEIFLKAGYNRWLCLAMIVPVVNLIVFLWFAFSKWPVYEFVEKGWQIKRMKSQQERIKRQIEQLEKDGGREGGKVGVEGQSSTVPGREVRYVGDKKTNVYHKISCSSVSLIESRSMVWFSTDAEAKRAGYVQCEACKSHLAKRTGGYVFCPECGLENWEGYEKCQKCGAKLIKR